MPIFHAIVLGLTQGLSEFLPISSSGHLILVPWLFDWNDLSDKSIHQAFDVSLHIGTLVAVLAYFRNDLVSLARDGAQAVTNRTVPPTPRGRLAWLLVVTAVPAGLVGALLDDAIAENLGRIPIVAVSLIGFGFLLLWADRQPGKRREDDFTMRDALAMGAGQVLALNPGTSRSGITITTGRYLAFDRDGAARLSFLMSIPVTAAAIIYKVGNLLIDGIPPGLGAPMVAGIIASGVSGWLAVWGTLKIVRTRSFAPFVAYRVALGVIVLGLAAVR